MNNKLYVQNVSSRRSRCINYLITDEQAYLVITPHQFCASFKLFKTVETYTIDAGCRGPLNPLQESFRKHIKKCRPCYLDDGLHCLFTGISTIKVVNIL